MSKKICPKIIKKAHSGYVSYTLKIVHNMRSPMTGKPTSEVIKNLGTLRSKQLSDPATRQRFWKDAETEFLRLALLGYMKNDIQRCRERFAEIVPLPSAIKLPAPLPAPVEANPTEIPSRGDLYKRFSFLAPQQKSEAS